MEQINSHKAIAWSNYLNWLNSPGKASNRPITFVRYFLRLVFITTRQFKHNDLSLRSGALTYAILLSMVPMLAMSTAVVKGLGGGNQLREAAYTYIETLEKMDHSSPNAAPPQASSNKTTPLTESADKTSLTNHLRSAVTQLFDYVDRTNFATLGTFGVVGILLSVLLVLSNIETAMNSIWKVTEGRPILRKIADYLTLLILLPLSINLAFAASAFLQNAELALAIDSYIPLDWIQTLLLQALPIFFITLSFYVMYIFFPNTKVKNLPALIGAGIAACFWVIIQNIYISMQIGVAKYNAIYGSFATVPLFLVWIYLSWVFILAGAQIAFALQNEKKFTLVEPPQSPSIRLSAAFDIMNTVFSFFNKGERLSKDELIPAVPDYSPQLIDSVTKDLLEFKLITVSGKDKRYLPLFPQDQYDKARVIEAILGNTAPDTTGGELTRGAIKDAMQCKILAQHSST